MAKKELKEILEETDLKEFLEKKGFKKRNETTVLLSNKKGPERYITLNLLLELSLYEKNERIIIELSEMNDSGDYFVKMYSKKE